MVDQLVEQIEFADTSVLDKVADATPDQLAAARTIVRSLNPVARLVATSFGRAPLAEILGTGRFDPERAYRLPGWIQELHGFEDHVPETEAYGIESLTFRDRRPLHPGRFHALLQESWPVVVRAKGLFWLATRRRYVGEMSLAGAVMRTQALGLWWAAVPRAGWPVDPESRSRIEGGWDPRWGDRCQELVFIGKDIDPPGLERRVAACLLTEAELRQGSKGWSRLPDPFPRWGQASP